MDCVEELKEGAEEIVSGAGNLETLSRMQERVVQIAGGSAPWHLSESQLNAELFDVLRKVWNFSLGLEKTTTTTTTTSKPSDDPEYFGMLRYFCVGVVLYLVVERGINDAVDDDDVDDDVAGNDGEAVAAAATKMNTTSLSVFQLLRMTLHTGRVCLECVEDSEKAQFCFQIVIQHYGKIREAGSPEQIQIVLREIIRILYANGKIFQSETEDQEVLKGLLLATSVLAKDCPDEGSCFAALCLRNGIRLAGMNRHRKAAVWLTAATRNAHFLDAQNHALALRRLAQVYYDWGAIDDFPDVVAGLDKANLLVYRPTGGLLKLKIVLASKSSSSSAASKDPLDTEIESLISDLLDRVDVGSAEAIVDELEALGFRSAAVFALDHVLKRTGSLSGCAGGKISDFLTLFLRRFDFIFTETRPQSHQHHQQQQQQQQPQQQQQQQQQQNRQKQSQQQKVAIDFYRFLSDESIRHSIVDLPAAKKRNLSSKLHAALWNLAKACVARREFRESVDWYRLSFKLLSSSRPRIEAKLRRNLAKCFVELGDFAAAHEQMEAALRLDPDCLLSLYRSYTVKLHSGTDVDETLRAFEKLLTAEDNNNNNNNNNNLEEDPAEDITVESVVSLALDETFKSSGLEVIEAVIEKTLRASKQQQPQQQQQQQQASKRRVSLSNQTVLVVLRRALQLVFERRDAASAARRVEYLENAFEILKEEIQKPEDGLGDKGLRRTMLEEVDWFTPMAWNTIGSSVGEASMEDFLLTFKFLALKEVKIRETLDSVERGGGGGGGGGGAAAAEEEKRRSSMTVNLDMQNRMLGNAVDAGLRKVRDLSSGGGVSSVSDNGGHLTDGGGSSSSSSPSAVESKVLTETLEMLYKICEKRRRVLAELESFAGASESLTLMAAVYHFEVCAKTRRHSRAASLLGEIADLAAATEASVEASIPAFTVFESLVDICAEPPADHLANYLVVCDCLVLAMKARAAAAAAASCRRSSGSTAAAPAGTALTTTPQLTTMPKVFEDALDFVGIVAGFQKGEMTAIAERVTDCFFQFLSSSSSSVPSSSSPSSSTSSLSPANNEATSSISTVAIKSSELGLRCRRDDAVDAASKWLRLALALAKRGGLKELQSKFAVNLERLVAGQKQ